MKDTRLEVLRMGADDYIIKPFDLDEVLVRIEVVMRRTVDVRDEAGEASSEVLSYAGIVLNKELNFVMFKDSSIS